MYLAYLKHVLVIVNPVMMKP